MEHAGKYVSYLRVSTARQGADGYGIDAQREAIRAHLNGGGATVIWEYVETESGARDDRPKLAAAIEHCRREGAVLVVSKLDRLARDAAYVLALTGPKGIKVCFCDLPALADVPPEMARLMLTIMSGIAEWERKVISRRTTAALAVAKARGVKLGTAGAANIGATVAVRKAKADADALRVRAFVEGATDRKLSLRRMVAELNDLNVPAPRGGSWSVATMGRVVARIRTMEPPPKKRGPGRPRKVAQIGVS